MAAYTEKEKMLLEHLVRNNSVLENKQLGSSSAEKRVAWEAVTSCFNAHQYCITPRRTQQLKKLWSNLKQKKRKESVLACPDLVMIGSGPPKKPCSDPLGQADDETDYSFYCPWDSDALFFRKEQERMDEARREAEEEEEEEMSDPDVPDLVSATPWCSMPGTSLAVESGVPQVLAKDKSVPNTVQALNIPEKVSETRDQEAELFALRRQIAEEELQERQIARKKTLLEMEKAEEDLQKARAERQLADLKLEHYKKLMGKVE